MEPSPATPSPELAAHIARRLGNHANLDDLLLELCEQRGISWREAEALVAAAEALHHRQIARRRAIPLLVICMLAALWGLALAVLLVDLRPQPGVTWVSDIFRWGIFLQGAPGFLLGAALVIGAGAAFGRLIVSLRNG